MIDLRISYRKKGLHDVFVRGTCPPVRAGVICSVVPRSIWQVDWVFLPCKWFAHRYPVAKVSRKLIAHTRAQALYAYLQEVTE